MLSVALSLRMADACDGALTDQVWMRTTDKSCSFLRGHSYSDNQLPFAPDGKRIANGALTELSVEVTIELIKSLHLWSPFLQVPP